MSQVFCTDLGILDCSFWHTNQFNVFQVRTTPDKVEISILIKAVEKHTPAILIIIKVSETKLLEEHNLARLAKNCRLNTAVS